MADLNQSTNPLLIPELLEQVALHLATTDMVKIRRTSRFWRTVIDGSPKMRKYLFTTPTNVFESLVWMPMTHEWQGFVVPETHFPVLADTATPQDREELPLAMCPIISFHPILLQESRDLDYKTSTVIEVEIRNLHRIKPGVWLDMLISQPPVQKLRYYVGPGPGGRSMVKEYIWITVPKNSKAGGLTFRHLLESTTLCTTKEKRKLKTCRCPDSGNAWGRHEIFPSVSEGYTGCMCCLRIPPKKIQLDFGKVLSEHNLWVRQAMDREPSQSPYYFFTERLSDRIGF